jgi:hypothetical protein
LRSPLAAARPETPAPMMTTSQEAVALSPFFMLPLSKSNELQVLYLGANIQCGMPDTPLHRIFLSAHPTTQSESIQRLDVQLSLQSPRLVTLIYTLRADMSRIRVGTEVAPGPADGLWKHTCFEVFMQPGESRGYYEFNFSPTKQWAVYRFDAYREGMTPMDLATPPDISTRKSDDCLELHATFALPFSADAGAARRTKLALAAVVEEESGRLCYWSGRHPQGKPDFHHSDGFAFEL